MAKKNKKITFDFKQFLLQKGERVGLLLAGLAMLGLIAAGATAALKSDSPVKTADDLRSLARKVDTHLKTTPNETPPNLDPRVTKDIDKSQVAYDQFRWNTELFPPINPTDTKRRNPEILGINEFFVDRIQGPVAIHDVAEKGGKLEIAVLVPAGSATPQPNKQRKPTTYEVRLQRLAERNPQYAQQVQQELQRVQNISMQQITRAAIANQDTPDKFRLEYAPVDKVPDGAKLAEARYPVRMVVVTASFPYREQLERFRTALRLGSLDELLKEKESLPQFLGVNVQRRALKTGADPKNENSWKTWEDVDFDKDRNVRWAQYRYLLSRAIEIEPDEEKLTRTVIFNKLLVMPRPRLGRSDVSYAEAKLPSIDQTVAKFPAQDKAKGLGLTESPLNRKLNQAQDLFETEEQKPAANFNPGFDPSEPTKSKDVFVPDACMIRFVDMTVEPGNTYQYRLQIKMANPNFGKDALVAFPQLAKVEEILGDWTALAGPEQKPIQVTLPEEKFYYAVTEKMLPFSSPLRDQTFIQMHQYMDRVRLDPNNRASEVPIGDWVIGNVPVYRGEKISRLVDNVDVLMYFPTREGYDLVRSKDRFGRPKGIAVDFTAEDLLVDFEGGQGQNYSIRSGTSTRSIPDSGSAEVLILTGDGKVVARNTGIDLNDKERVSREETQQSKITAAKTKTTGAPATGIFGK